MPSLVVFTIVALASLVSCEQPIGAFNYHEEVGIAEAARIKRVEDAVDFDGARIVGGSAAGAGAHPHLVGIVIALTSGRQSVCSASMLTNTRTLTAAHCWWDGANQARTFTLVFGSALLFSGGVRVATSSVAMHENWRPWNSYHNDIAVVNHNSVGYNNVIQRIILPPNNMLNNNFVNAWGQAAGFGRTHDAGASTTKHHVSLQVITNDVCFGHYGFAVDRGVLCTSGAGGRGPCQGDSGGPLAIISGGQRIVVGIVIALTSGWQSVCSAPMLTNTRTLTAAHCWWDGPSQARTLTLDFGSAFIFSGGVRITTSSVTMHGNWIPWNIDYDITIDNHFN